MARKVRHVHAKKNEYIAVHRGGTSRGGTSRGGSDGGDSLGCFYILAVLLGYAIIYYLLVNFWYIILMIGAIALIICFRKPIWRFLKLIWHSCETKYQQNKATKQIKAAQQAAQQAAQTPQPVQTPTPVPSSNTAIGSSQNINNHPYGKIVQYKN